MIASRVERGLAAAVVCGLVLSFQTARDLSAQPLKLQRSTPVLETAPTGKPPTSTPESPARPPVADPAPAAGGEAIIVVNPLRKLDPDAVGLLEEGQGGLPIGLWQGTRWATVAGLLPRLPDSVSSPTVRDLVRRLLASRASVPEDKPDGESLLALRVDRLLAIGAIEAATGLLAIAPDELRDERFARTQVETLFYGNNNADACGRVRAAAGRYDTVYWQQAQAFCFALAGDHSRAGLIADILREREREVEPAFFALIEALAGARNVKVSALSKPLALHLAMMRASSVRLPPAIIESAPPTVLRSVALSPNADLDLRLLAAERAHAAGGLSDADLIALYRGIPFSKDELTNPISQAEANWGVRGRALLVRAASVQEVPIAKAEALRRGWQLGRARGGFDALAGASAQIVAGIEPSVDLIWFARDAARVLFAAGRLPQALAWYRLAAADAARIEEARDAEADLWPLAVLAAPLARPVAEPASESAPGSSPGTAPRSAPAAANEPAAGGPAAEGPGLDLARLDKWYAARRAAAPDRARGQAIAFYALLDATGRTVPADSWRRLLLDGGWAADRAPLDQAWMQSLAGASSGLRIGEAVLLIGIGLRTAGDKGFDIQSARHVVQALRRVNLEPEARAIAVEIALAAGL